MQEKLRTIRVGRSGLQSAGKRRGVVWGTVAVALVALMGMAALTIDLGRMAVSVQRAQAVADAAAMGAANQLPDTDLANARLADVVSGNNEANPWPQVAINPDQDVTYYTSGEEVPDYGVLDSSELAVTVQAHVNEEYGFAKVAGLEQMNIVRTATAKTTFNPSSLPVLFAGQEVDWEDGFVSSGSGVYIDGAIHSNSSVVIHGSHITITGLVEYRYSLVISGSDIDLQQGSVEGEIEPYPVNYTWDDFLPWDYEVGSLTISEGSMEFGHVHVNGDLTVNSSGFQGSNGLVMVEGNVVFNGSGAQLNHVTIIAKGTIKFNGACQSMTPYVENVTLISFSTADKAIVFDGAGQATEGILFAPNGGINFHGADASCHNGSLIGLEVTMRGGQYTVAGTQDDSQILKTVQLIK